MWPIQGEFRGRGWADVAEWFDELHREQPGFESHQYMRDIVASVLASGAADRLGVTTSMHDIVVVSLDAKTWYHETIRVFSPSSLPPVRDGFVMLTFSGSKSRRRGSRETVQCTVEEAAPAFWDLVEEKFGITR
ncbi:hypothetical protein [Lentzea flaviverrucosa]|uniref:Uncharacterized protein n=1 Tax=Lentzea flaviverrucosa TaxID=200379 RepID=A0A1H9UQZ8_9PSEU|nr:hypothetical protein [Lentzea flaviverrucosa]RDI27774.1 hypothetical protein DFR72_106261 [Lentzea flaviverrucosa]SES11915.1 hypothetical protein SAMN05216195_10984 [Lentzea flaviverrucosa]